MTAAIFTHYSLYTISEAMSLYTVEKQIPDHSFEAELCPSANLAAKIEKDSDGVNL